MSDASDVLVYRYRYSWERECWLPANAFTVWVLDGAPISFEYAGRGYLYRDMKPVVEYCSTPPTEAVH